MGEGGKVVPIKTRFAKLIHSSRAIGGSKKLPKKVQNLSGLFFGDD